MKNKVTHFLIIIFSIINTQILAQSSEYIYLKISDSNLIPIAGIYTNNEYLNNLLDFHSVTDFSQTWSIGDNEEVRRIYEIHLEGSAENLIEELNPIEGIYDIEKVEYSEPLNCTNPYQINDPLILNQWSNDNHLQMLDAYCAWTISTGNPDIVVGVIDTEFDLTHEDLTDRIVSVNGNNPNALNCPHGTAVSGCVATSTNNNKGIAGIGYNTSISGYIVPTSSTCTGVWTPYLQQAVEDKVQIVNISWSGGNAANQRDIIEDIVGKNITVIVAAGNDVNQENHTAYSDVPGVIVVSGIDENNMHGPTGKARNEHVDVCALSENVTTTQPNDNYGGAWGTSFAAPQVAGVAALLLDVNPCLSPGEIENLIKLTTDPISDGHLFLGEVGTGKVNAYTALLNAQIYGQHPAIINSTTFSNDYFVKDELVVENGGHLTVTGTIRFAKDAKLIVKQGGKLTVDGGTLTNSIGCQNEFWAGIEVWGYNYSNQTAIQGQVELINGAVIENAKDGIRAWEPGNYNSGGGIVDVNNATFKNCRRAIEFILYNAENSKSRIVNSTFVIDDDYIQTTYDYRPISQISLWNISGVEIRTNDFINENTEFQNSNPVYYWGTGVKSMDAEYINTHNTYEGFYNGIDLNGILFLPATEIKSNTFKSCRTGIFIRNGHYTRINTNTFEDCVAAGAHIWSSNGFELHHNTFDQNNSAPLGSPAVSRGLYLDRLGSSGNGFYNNAFSDNNMAANTFGNNRGLSFDCNDFDESNLFDVLAMRNAGDPSNLLSNLGSHSEPLANLFSTPCIGSSHNFNLASNHPPIQYIHFNPSTEPRLEPTCTSNNITTSYSFTSDYPENYCSTPGSPLDPKHEVGQVGSIAESAERLELLDDGLSGKKATVESVKEDVYTLIDDGQTQDYLSLIADETETSSTLAATFSGDVAPFVSAEVLSACLSRDPEMDETDLLNVLLANSPLPWKVQMDSVLIYEKLSDQDYYDSLWLHQSGVSPVDSLQNMLFHVEKDLERLLNKTVITLLTDTFVVSGEEEAFNYMISYTSAEEMLIPKLRLAWQLGYSVKADSLLAELNDIDAYEDFAEILSDMNAAFGEFENPMVLYTESTTFQNKVHNLAGDTLQLGYEMARDIINQFEDTTFIYPIMNPELDPAGKKAGKDHIIEELESEKTDYAPKFGSSIRLYPNPARHEIRIAGDQSERFKEYRILSIDGRLVKSGRLSNEQVISAKEISSGLYVVVLLHDEGNITRKIVIE